MLKKNVGLWMQILLKHITNVRLQSFLIIHYRVYHCKIDNIVHCKCL